MGKTREWLKLLLAGVLVNGAWEWAVKPLFALMGGTASGLMAWMQNEPVRRAAAASGILAGGEVVLVALFFALTALIYASSLMSRWNKHRGGEPMRWGLPLAALTALLATLVVTNVVVELQVETRQVYREFHANLASALPTLSREDERALRSQFAQAQTRADMERIREQLQQNLAAAGLRYVKP